MQAITMKHPTQQNRTLSLFDRHMPREKGSREWGTFTAVHEDSVGAYCVALPTKPIIVRGPRNLLHIINPPSRFLRSAH